MGTSLTEYIAYYLSILTKAIKDTILFFGWNKRNLVWPLSIVSGFLVYWKWQGLDKVTEEIQVFISFILVPAGAFAILLFLINAIKAPFLKAKENRGEYNVKVSSLEAELNSTKERLLILEEERIPKIVAEPITCKPASYERVSKTAWAELKIKNTSSDVPLEDVNVQIAELIGVFEKQDERGVYFLHDSYPDWNPSNIYWSESNAPANQLSITIPPGATRYALIAFHPDLGPALGIFNTLTYPPMLESKIAIEVSSPNTLTWRGEFYIEYHPPGRDEFEFVEWDSWCGSHNVIE